MPDSGSLSPAFLRLVSTKERGRNRSQSAYFDRDASGCVAFMPSGVAAPIINSLKANEAARISGRASSSTSRPFLLKNLISKHQLRRTRSECFWNSWDYELFPDPSSKGDSSRAGTYASPPLLVA
jgi:hypothetical protein